MRAVAVTLIWLVPVFLVLSLVFALLSHGRFTYAVLSFAAAGAGALCFVASFCFEFAHKRKGRNARLASRQP